MSRFVKQILVAVVVLLVLAGMAMAIVSRLAATKPEQRSRTALAVPVEVAPVTRGHVEDRRTFSGTLEPIAQSIVAPKVGGRVERVLVQLGDSVQRGQVVAELDDDEFVQAVTQAEADLAVANATLAEAQSAVEIASREYERVQTLGERGVASASELDVVESDRQTRRARVEVTRAQLRRAESALASSKIRLEYTRVRATWPEGGDDRVIAERFVDAGSMVAANAPLVSVVQADPLHAIVYVTERDYTRLKVGQEAVLVTDVFPGDSFPAKIARLAPVFRETSRQARVELTVDNPQQRLKPGMFARITIVLDVADEATIVPVQALVSRNGQQGVFVVDPAGTSVRFRLVQVGIRDGARVQVTGEGVEGRVVVLGQQLLQDGSTITIPDQPGDAQRTSGKEAAVP